MSLNPNVRGDNPVRISRDKSLPDPDAIRLSSVDIQTSVEGRKRELGALIQAALKVGADLAARESGRRAFAEFVKLDRDLQPAPNVTVANSGQLLFANTKRRRVRAVM
jgi:hypothetical protein